MMKNLLKSIISIEGIDDIVIGMNFTIFSEKYITYKQFYDDETLKMYAVFPHTIKYVFYDSISVYFDIPTLTLKSICLENIYEGKYLNKIGLGSKVKELIKYDISFVLDDECIMVLDNNINCRIIFVTDGDPELLDSVAEIQEFVIEEIWIKQNE